MENSDKHIEALLIKVAKIANDEDSIITLDINYSFIEKLFIVKFLITEHYIDCDNLPQVLEKGGECKAETLLDALLQLLTVLRTMLAILGRIELEEI